MSVRYIGSKARVAEVLGDYIGTPSPTSGYFVDAFCGTGVVAEIAAKLGWSIYLNDFLASAVVMSAARLINSSEVPFNKFGGYQNTVTHLNNMQPVQGFIWREYSPASFNSIGIERHGGTVMGSSQAELQHWTVDIEHKTVIMGVKGYR